MRSEIQDILRAHKKKLAKRQRIREVIGILILFGGYASLAVSPETPSDWLLIRVVGGFSALLAGFGLAILPILTRAVGGDK